MTRDFDLLWDFGDPSGTEQRFRDLLTGPEASDPGYRNELLTQIARALGLQKRFDEALEVLHRVEADYPRVEARRALEFGRVLNSSGDQAASVPHFELALAKAEAAGAEYLAVDAAHMLAIVHPGEDGIRWARKGVEMARSAQDERTRNWQGALLNNLGWTLHDMERYDEALAVFEEAEAFRRAAGARGPWLIARYAVARAKRSLGRFEEALSEVKDLREEDGDDPYFAEEIGENLLALGREEEAVPFFAAAYEGLKDDIWTSDERKESLRQRGRVRP